MHDPHPTPDDLGRTASRPRDLPPRGWRQILTRTARQLDRDNIPIFAGGLAFFAMLSLTPLLIAIVSIYGLLSDPAAVEAQLSALAGILPPDVQALVAEQLNDIVGASSRDLGLGAALSIGGAFWAGSKATFYLFRALNTAYGEEERRGFIRLKLTALLFTVGFILSVVIAFALVAVLPAVLGLVGLAPLAERLISLGRWPALALFAVLGLAVLYRYGPSRARARWRWLSVGSLAGTGLWLVFSLLFSFYVSSFGTFNETYGSLGTVIVLLVWLFASTFLVLAGAVLNANAEHQTAEDTTTGAAQPMGERGAHVADTLPADRRPRPA